jgi:putative nucleotidyltransferase with HDIG domain
MTGIFFAAITTFFSDYYHAISFPVILKTVGLHALAITLYPIGGIFALPVFEKITGRYSRFTLSDYASPNQPLLAQLSVEAPGTYHHSMLVASLAESAAIETGANETLCRIGGYYHDIGKLSRPTYFNENDPPAGFRTDFTCRDCRYMIGHVREGVDIANANSLPLPISDMIRQHHGTTVMKYFLNRSREMGLPVLPDLFRYPGPKPRSKESAILMLADICEAGVRALSEKTQESIADVVNSLINERIEDGQLDDSNLSITDISKIKIVFQKVLLGYHHSRNLGEAKKDYNFEGMTDSVIKPTALFIFCCAFLCCLSLNPD